MDQIESGTLAGIGSFRCEECDYVITLSAGDTVPTCPGCGGTAFVRTSLFGDTPFHGRPWPDTEAGDDDWLREARRSVAAPGHYLAYGVEEHRFVLFALTDEWTRIGRSLTADIRFDDPTVSRRHALIMHGTDEVRVVDDRSLNGVFVNGERVESRSLADGDEVLVGCHSLRFIELAAVATAAAQSTA
jgi:FHA domain/Zinc-ribbon containing domain